MKKSRKASHKGQGLVEYILMIGLIALIAYGAIKTLGGEVSSNLGKIGGSLDNAVKEQGGTSN